MPDKNLHEANRQSWNAATAAHNSHKGDQAAFLRSGGSTLFDDEIALLGDVEGKTLLHLQCNAGQDTLSIASQLGAIVSGVDISDEAIAFAQKLSEDSGIPGQFMRSDLYDWYATNSTQYDTVFTSYGAINWLSDLKAWGEGIAAALKPGGRFVMIEFHPAMFMLDWDTRAPRFPYMGGCHIPVDEGVGDYVAVAGGEVVHDEAGQVTEVQNFQNPHPSHEFAWGIGDITGALLAAGLRLETLREYPYCNGFRYFTEMRELAGRRFVMPEGQPDMPLMLGITAVKE